MASADRRAAARLLFERSDADPEWIASLWGVEPGWLARLIAREGWQRRETDMTGTIDRLMRQVSAQLAAFEGDAETTGKARLDALLAITRTFDKLAEMRREEDARGGGKDDERALKAARRTVERRVGELATQRAETIIEHLEATNETGPAVERAAEQAGTGRGKAWLTSRRTTRGRPKHPPAGRARWPPSSGWSRAR